MVALAWLLVLCRELCRGRELGEALLVYSGLDLEIVKLEALVSGDKEELE